MMKNLILVLTVALTVTIVQGADPSFHDISTPQGWAVVKGQMGVIQAQGVTPLELATSDPVPLPVEATFRFRAALGDTIAIRVGDVGKDVKPLVECEVRQTAPNHAEIMAKSSGAPMATVAKSARRWDFRDTNTGTLGYTWRFPHVKNLWDERDYKEIGAAYSQLVSFDEKVFTLRLTVTSDTRQIWLDDRLVAEDVINTAAPARWSVRLTRTARLLSATFSTPVPEGRFLPLVLDHYSHAKLVQEAQPHCELLDLESVPLRVPQTGTPDINVGDSLYRYRLTHGSGPDTGYVNALSAWPGSFQIDPSLLTFRVPYRVYQNAWLLAWVDERPNTVAKATLRFFQATAGYPANTDLEISPEAIRKGLVTKLSRKTVAGKQLYLVKVPLDTEGLYGMRDRSDQFLEFDICKPVSLGRSYPDPIFYGYFPAGLPSSIHVVGITLEKAPFGFDVEPKHYGFVFEKPEKPFLKVRVSNSGSKVLDALVRVESASFDSSEKHTFEGRATIGPGTTGDVELTCDVKTLGWHELKVTVEAAGVTRAATLSMVLLPPDTRTYGDAINQSRFGCWSLGGHYVALRDERTTDASDKRIWETYHKLGLVPPATAHTIGRNFAAWNQGKVVDPEVQKKAIDQELANVEKLALRHRMPLYFYGGEWGAGSDAIEYGPWPLYTGDGDRPLDENVRKTVETQVTIFTAVGKAIREKYPQAKLLLQWGTPTTSLAHLRAGMPKNLVDGFGMDGPMFELLPELSNVTGSINLIWMLRQEAQRLGWPRLPIIWCEGPFFPTNPGALTERDQMDYQVRYLLLGLAYGIDQFPSGIVPQDGGNYYGAEHYGAGIFNRVPLDTPKPAVAAVATMTSMLCGADPVGGIDTGCLTTYCMEFRRARDQARIYALWRVTGTGVARLKVRGSRAVSTDAMGNATPVQIDNGIVRLTLSASPIWLTGVEKIEAFELDAPVYDTTPAHVTRALAEMTPEHWDYDGSADKAYDHNHFAIRRIPDANLKAEFGKGEQGFADAVAITLPVEPGDRPLATRYGALKARRPVTIPGKARGLGIWIKGNSSWGRVVYQLRDAKGQTWTSVGTKDDWNCDDTHAWSYVSFEGWRYVRFPLPGNHPYDAARDLETTWWGSHDGDGIVTLPLTLEKIIVEARNEVPYLGEMKLVPERTYKLSGLVAEYDAETDTMPSAIARNQVRMPLPAWTGPTENPIARLDAEGVGIAPEITGFSEPQHFNDGRQMHIHFQPDPALKYNLYVTRYPDGRGADLLAAGVTDNQLVGGLRPEMTMYLFLTSANAQKKESKPSQAYQLITHDKFLEK